MLSAWNLSLRPLDFTITFNRMLENHFRQFCHILTENQFNPFPSSDHYWLFGTKLSRNSPLFNSKHPHNFNLLPLHSTYLSLNIKCLTILDTLLLAASVCIDWSRVFIQSHVPYCIYTAQGTLIWSRTFQVGHPAILSRAFRVGHPAILSGAFRVGQPAIRSRTFRVGHTDSVKV